MFVRQRRAGLHRRAQEPEGRRRHRARHQAAAPLRDRDAGADRRAAALQRHAPARLLVRRHLERHPPRHGALEADAGRGLPLRRAGVLRARPTSCARSSTGFCSTSRTARRGSRCCASTSAAPSTRSSPAAPIPTKTRGLVWHTQGSGKTFTLLTAAQLILEEKERFKNATVILVVDRTELEGQLKGWVERLLGEMQKQDIADQAGQHQGRASGAARRRLPRPDHLDDPQVRGDPKGQLVRATTSTSSSTRRTARSPRTSAPTSWRRCRTRRSSASPARRSPTPSRATGTFKIFGAEDETGYLDKYSINESIADETTLPIKHVLAPSEMTVPAERLDKEFFDLADAEGVTDIEELNKVLDRAVGLRTFLTADDRVEKVAAFVAEHFKENVLPLGYKAFVVGGRPRGLRQVQAGARQAPAAGMDRGRLHRERRRRRRPAACGRAAAQRRARGGCPPAVQEGRQGPEDPDRHGQAADRLRRAGALLHVPRQADARPRPASGDRAREPAVRRRRRRPEARRPRRRFRRRAARAEEGAAVRLVRRERRDRGPRSPDAATSSTRSRRRRPTISMPAKAATPTSGWSASSTGGSSNPEPRKAFFEAYKDIENLWEILSPSPELATTSRLTSA